ncbi:MAG: RNA-guided endonuclease IscB, partial [Prevotellaceae bacterium]|nr:RNA-guided endonuclease IscB [Prevotellaceae bacterium]
ISHSGKALMPTEHYGKVRILLRDRLAVVVRHTPFTIRLEYETKEYVQDVTLGVDAGSKTIGMSATTDSKELYSSEVLLRNDVTSKLSTRLEYRRTRRNRKTRYRKARFDNRKRSEGWVAPSVKTKLNEHLQAIRTVCDILPIKKIVVEVAQFDTQKIKNEEIHNEEYQQGEQLGFWNVREYVLFRDGHKCQHCKGKSKDKVLNVHHLDSRKTGGNAPNNLITLCNTCHKEYHQGKFELKVKRGVSLRDAAFMSIIRWKVYEMLKSEHTDKDMCMTYGYITKHRRISNGVEKTHCADAYCIAGNLNAIRMSKYYNVRCVARHSRSLHVANPKKGGIRRSAVASHWIGKSKFQRFDIVKWNGIRCFIFGSTGGRPVLKDIEGKLVTPSASVNANSMKYIGRKQGAMLYQLIEK